MSALKDAFCGSRRLRSAYRSPLSRVMRLSQKTSRARAVRKLRDGAVALPLQLKPRFTRLREWPEDYAARPFRSLKIPHVRAWWLVSLCLTVGMISPIATMLPKSGWMKFGSQAVYTFLIILSPSGPAMARFVARRTNPVAWTIACVAASVMSVFVTFLYGPLDAFNLVFTLAITAAMVAHVPGAFRWAQRSAVADVLEG